MKINYYLKKLILRNKVNLGLLALQIFLTALSIFFTDAKGTSFKTLEFENNNEFQTILLKDFLIVWFFQISIPIFLPLVYYFIFSFITKIVKDSENDGNDVFFLSNAIPISRKRLFIKKNFYSWIISFLILMIFVIFPDLIARYRINTFSSLSNLKIASLFFSAIVILPLFFVLPFFILISSVCSLSNLIYNLLKWGGLVGMVLFFIFKSKISDYLLKPDNWISKIINMILNNCLLSNIFISLTLITLASMTFLASYKKYLKKDLA